MRQKTKSPVLWITTIAQQGKTLKSIQIHLEKQSNNVLNYDSSLDLKSLEIDDESDRQIPFYQLTHSEQLLSRMNKLRKAEHLCDVTLKVEQTHFPAHRLVLAAASDYFAAMFTGEVRPEIADDQIVAVIDEYQLEFCFSWLNAIWMLLNSKDLALQWWKFFSIQSMANQL